MKRRIIMIDINRIAGFLTSFRVDIDPILTTIANLVTIFGIPLLLIGLKNHFYHEKYLLYIDVDKKIQIKTNKLRKMLQVFMTNPEKIDKLKVEIRLRHKLNLGHSMNGRIYKKIIETGHRKTEQLIKRGF
jgi:hypothetical protein